MEVSVGVSARALGKELLPTTIDVILKVRIGIIYKPALVVALHFNPEVLEILQGKIDSLSMELHESGALEREADDGDLTRIMASDLFEATNGEHYIFQGVPGKVFRETAVKDVVGAILGKIAQLLGGRKVAMGFCAQTNPRAGLTARENED